MGVDIKDKTDDELVEIAGLPESIQKMQKFKAPMAQAELLRRNTNALIESGKSADRYADKMMGLSLIVGLIAFLQLIFEILSSSTTVIEKIVYGFGAVGLIAFAFRDYFIVGN